MPSRSFGTSPRAADSPSYGTGVLDSLGAANAAEAAAEITTARAEIERAVLLLADLHLSPSIPKTVEAFERFLDNVDSSDVREVYILGDLFEFWIGDDMLSMPFVAGIVTKMAALQKRGIQLFVMHGNRDFLLGQRFAKAAGAKLIPDPTILEVFSQRWILTHGDALCTDDHDYQRFRRVSRKRWLQAFFLSWPLAWRMRLAGNMRANSERQGRSKMHISDVNLQAVRALFERYSLRHMIQGHTHRPARHEEYVDLPQAPSEAVQHLQREKRVRWVLPDWELDTLAGEPPLGGYLRIDANGARCLSVVPEVSERHV